MTYIAAVVAGLGAGAVYALLAVGVVVAYRGSGVINLGHGAIATWCAYVYADLRSTARYPLPLPGPWRHISLGAGARTTTATAMVMTLATGALLGLAAYWLVFGRLRRSPQLARVVAGVGLLLFMQAMIAVRFSSASLALPKLLPGGATRVGRRIIVAHDAVWLAAIAVAIALVLAGLARWTRTGLAVRAAAESEKGAILAGFSPERLGAMSWVLSATLAAAVGMLAAPLFELTPLLFTQLLIPALGAALIARFTSLAVAVAAGLAIGAVQALTTPLQRDFDWLPRTGLRDGVVFVTIIVAMMVVGHRLPTRGMLDVGRQATALPPDGRRWAGPLLAAAVVMAFLALPADWGSALLTSVIFTGLALSLVVLTGFVGQISLAQAAIAGIAGFALSRLTQRFGVPFPLAPVLAALVATVFGLVIGVPALRVRGVNLAIVTLAAGIAVQEFVFKNPEVIGDVSTGGAKIDPPKLGSLDLGLQAAGEVYRSRFGVLCTLVVGALAWGVTNLRRSGTGRRMLAVRGNERAAAAAGVGVASTKLVAFGVSSFIAGIAGTLMGYRFGAISDASFGLFASLTLLAFAYLGGITSVRGALIAGVLAAGGIGFKLINTGWRELGVSFGRWELVVGAIGLIVTAVRSPEGLAGVRRPDRQVT